MASWKKKLTGWSICQQGFIWCLRTSSASVLVPPPFQAATPNCTLEQVVDLLSEILLLGPSVPVTASTSSAPLTSSLDPSVGGDGLQALCSGAVREWCF